MLQCVVESSFSFFFFFFLVTQGDHIDPEHSIPCKARFFSCLFELLSNQAVYAHT